MAAYAGGSATERALDPESAPSKNTPIVTAASKVQPKKHLPTAITTNRYTELASTASSGEATYIITFEDEPVAMYRGGIMGYEPTHKSMLNLSSQREKQYETLTGNTVSSSPKKRVDYIAHPSVKAYKQYLEKSQHQFVAAASRKLNREIDITHRYQLALNGVAAKLTSKEASKLMAMPGIKSVRKEVVRNLHTDTGPTHIGAAALWQGTVNNLEVKGEGITVGIIDTGVNTDHLSFATQGDDGYSHTSPTSSGFLGDCVDEPNLCNDKLIGVYSYADVTDQYAGERPANGEDYNGHGSHTASTVAGNVLHDVPLLTPSGEITSDGFTRTDFSFPEISGVAPHANIVSYQVCLPGDPGDTLVGCFPSLAVQAVEDAIANGVDVLNYSIGGGSSDPWLDPDAQAFLSAREAGIVVVSSAGNSGPDPETVGSPADAPWLTSVAAFTHGRTYERELSAFTGGDAPPSESMIGLGQPGRDRTAEVVYAGNAPYNDPMCLSPLTETRVSQKIVVCDRGEIPLVEKADNVFQGGGLAVIIANSDPEIDTLFDIPYSIDGIHVNYDAGEQLRAWLASGANHSLTLSAGNVKNDETKADQAAEFSSRGPNLSVPDIIVPSIGAPGVSIYAAYADDQPFKSAPGTADFGFLSGTSMASPHVAGAAALLKQLRPDWTVSDIHSALLLTANHQIGTKEDGISSADPFDNGSGLARVDLAAEAGLSLRESIDNFRAANPEEGGSPSQLNLAQLGNSQCVGSCKWTRTFTALKAGTYQLSATGLADGMHVSITPSEFTVAEGQTQAVEFEADVLNSTNNTWAFGNIDITPVDSSLPALHMPIATYVSLGNLPEKVTIKASRDADSYIIEDREAVAIEQFTARAYGLVAPELTHMQIAQDTDNQNDLFDDLTDGVEIFYFDVPEDSVRFIAEITESSAPDLDLVLGFDADDNNEVNLDNDAVICVSAEAHAYESCDLISPPAGRYWVVVNNYQGSAANAIDTFTLAQATLTRNTEANMAIAATESQIAQLTPFDITISYDHDTFLGDKLYGAFDLGTDEENPGRIGMVAVDLIRDKNDVSMEVVNSEENTQFNEGDTVDLRVAISKNFTLIDRDYTIDVTLPEGLQLIPESLPEGITIAGNGFSLTRTMASQGEQTPSYTRVTNAETATCKVPDVGQNGGYIHLDELGILPDAVLGSGQFASEVFTYFPDEQFHFFGENRNRGMSISEDGYVFFDSGVDAFSFSNQALPDPSLPNDAISLLWRDLVFDHNIDPAAGELAGVSIAKATTSDNSEFAIVEWQNGYGFFDAGGYTNFELIMRLERDLSEGAYEIVMAYDDMVYNPSAFFTGTTVGIENKDATWGDTFVYKGFTFFGPPEVGDVGSLSQGLVICYDVNSEFFLPETIEFSAEITEGYAGSLLDATVDHSVSVDNTNTESERVLIQVESNLNLNSFTDIEMLEDGVYENIEVIAADRNGTDNTIEVSSLSGQVSIVNFVQDGNRATFSLQPNENYFGLDEIVVTVSDNSVTTDTVSEYFNVNILPVNDAPTITVSNAYIRVNSGDPVSFTASANDVEDGEVSLEWKQLSGSAVTVSSLTNPTIRMTAPDVSSKETLRFEVTATDSEGASSSNFVTAYVEPRSGGGSMGWLLLTLIPALLLRSRKKH